MIVSGLNDDERRAAYRCDVVYGTNKELGFDYLRYMLKIEDIGSYYLVTARTPARQA